MENDRGLGCTVCVVCPALPCHCDKISGPICTEDTDLKVGNNGISHSQELCDR